MILLYGAYGYTGELIARRAARMGIEVVLAGRRLPPLTALSAELGLPHRCFPLEHPAELAAGIQGARAVLNCAGPFAHTAGALVAACLAARVHYLDITGEVEVIEAVASRGREASEAGVTLLPGAGFDVVPSDCLAARVSARLPGAHRLRLAFETSTGASRGTLTTALQNAGRPGLVRRQGQLVPIRSGSSRLQVDLGSGPQEAIGIPWGDLVSAFHSTGIPDIETFVCLPPLLRWSIRAAPLLALRPVRALVQARIRRGPAGPSDGQRERGHARLWAEAAHPDGRAVQMRMRTPEPYELTSWTALELAVRAARGQLPVGYQTPSRACGPDFALSFPGVSTQDVAMLRASP